ncbi:MAG: hypothetical protein K2X57_15535 [Xanthobacteraceae bacterium]|nr:hypothetical protein [Xanthobacteraceae bacterium]
MKKILLVMLLAASPAWAQTPLTPKAAPKAATARVADVCAPIGKTAKGELVYSMKCDNLPAPPPPPPQAEAREAAPAAAREPEVKRGGIFGWSYDRRE